MIFMKRIKKILIASLILMSIFLVACAKTDKPVACTMDAKVCPNGSFVGRIAPNCEFAPCPNSNNCTCPENYIKEGDVCTPRCYYSEPRCLMPSIQCK
jgi:hypothetical protein